jgi:hypothetical protein
MRACRENMQSSERAGGTPLRPDGVRIHPKVRYSGDDGHETISLEPNQVACNMYLYIVVLLMGVLPLFSVFVEAFAGGAHADTLHLVGKWFVFWSVGVRLFLAGLRQSVQPRYTAEKIFELEKDAPLHVIQELGFANISIGLLGLVSLANREWCIPAAATGATFYCLAGFKHLKSKNRNSLQNVAMISDLFVFCVLAVYLAATFATKA